MSHRSPEPSSTTGYDEAFDVEDVFDELEELEEIVDSDEELEQIRETMRVLRRTRHRRPFGRLRDTFGSRDVGEALVGSFVFGMPMIVEDGTLEIGRFVAGIRSTSRLRSPSGSPSSTGFSTRSSSRKSAGT